jgi:hypothetical protein
MRLSSAWPVSKDIIVDILKLLCSVNIFFERVPAYEPSVGCPNPEARAAIKCALYGEKIFTGQLTNFGQARGPADAKGTAFQVVMSGSNGKYIQALMII